MNTTVERVESSWAALMDAIAANSDMTVVIMDNETVAMTGGQPSIMSSSRLECLITALGVNPDHFHVLNAHPRFTDANAEVIRNEITYRGLSVIVAVRECIETARKHKPRRSERP